MTELEMTASGGLAPARCPGLIASLRPPRLAAPGAGHDVTPVTAEQKFVVARGALRVALFNTDCLQRPSTLSCSRIITTSTSYSIINR